MLVMNQNVGNMYRVEPLRQTAIAKPVMSIAQEIKIMSSCSCVYVDVDVGSDDFFSAIKRTARKQHQCSECGDTIHSKDKYEYISGKWDGSFSKHKTCLPCLEVREEFFCNGSYLGELWQSLQEHLWENLSAEIFTCIAALSPPARNKVCDLIEKIWTLKGEDD